VETPRDRQENQLQQVEVSGVAPFMAGQVVNHMDAWQRLSSDQWIANTVMGYTIDFVDTPLQTCLPKPIRFSKQETFFLELEIQDLLNQNVIEQCESCEGEFISNFFLRPKKNGQYRFILNLSKLNPFISYHKVKMDSALTVAELMTPNCYMCSIDLRHAYYSVMVAQEDRKFMRFYWRDTLFQFTCLANGLSPAPRVFTKLLKPVYATLQEKGFVSSGYIDDSYLQGCTKLECIDNVHESRKLLTELGFTINFEKSVFIPTQRLLHLGFVYDSILMTMELSEDKKIKIVHMCGEFIKKQTYTIREVASLIGTLVSCLPAVEFGQLYYRQLECEKIDALKCSRGNFEALMTITPDAVSELKWWRDNVTTAVRPINRDCPRITMATDASMSGWGAVCGEQRTGGRWSIPETELHINVLELTAALLGLQALHSSCKNTNFLLQLDNTTAVAYVNAMGGTHSKSCNEVARRIWLWAIPRGIFLTATHLPGALNTDADFMSRVFHDQTEWKLDPSVFVELTELLGKPTIDLFASRLNFQLKPYVAWMPDPEAIAIDAFTISWSDHTFYAFPPFRLITRFLKKVREDGARGILVAPSWSTQPWYPMLRKMAVQAPVELRWRGTLLFLPYKEGVHPLGAKLHLAAWLLSGKRL
jgi:hypothetical protein